MHRTDCLWGAKRNGADLGRSMVLILEILSSRASVETNYHVQKVVMAQSLATAIQTPERSWA